MVKGKVAVTLGGKHLATLTAGACFGEMAYFNEIIAPRSTTITALEPLFVLEIKASSLRLASEVCQNAFQRAFIDMLLERLTQANRRLAELTREPNEPSPKA